MPCYQQMCFSTALWDSLTIIERLGLEGTLKTIQSRLPDLLPTGAGCPLPHPTSDGAFEHLWDIHSFTGQQLHCLNTLCVKNFLLSSILSLSSFFFQKLFLLVLSAVNHIESLSCFCLCLRGYFFKLLDIFFHCWFLL